MLRFEARAFGLFGCPFVAPNAHANTRQNFRFTSTSGNLRTFGDTATNSAKLPSRGGARTAAVGQNRSLRVRVPMPALSALLPS